MQVQHLNQQEFLYLITRRYTIIQAMTQKINFVQKVRQLIIIVATYVYT